MLFPFSFSFASLATFSVKRAIPFRGLDLGEDRGHRRIHRDHGIMEVLAGFLHRLMGILHCLLKGRVLLDRLVMGRLELGALLLGQVGHRTMGPGARR